MATVLLATGSRTMSVTVHRYHTPARLLAHVCADRIDHALAAGIVPDSTVAASLRAQTLIGVSARRILSRSLRDLTHQARTPAPRVYPVPLCRRKVLAAEELLEQIADRLVAARPVAPCGVAQIRVLLTDGRSPFYCHPDADDLEPALVAASEALEFSWPTSASDP
jgi:hypothetical protein